MKRLGKSVTIRHITKTGTHNPAINPPLFSPVTVNGLTASGATSINLQATVVSGRLIIGDIFNIGDDPTDYTVSADINASSNAFTGVTFTPALTLAAANGASVTFNFLNETTVKGAIQSFPIAQTDGTLIQFGDLRINIPAVSLSFTPIPSDRVIVDGETYNIVNVMPVYNGSVVVYYGIHARK